MAIPMLSTLSINGDRFLTSIATLAKIGQLPNGGVERIAYSPEDVQARQLVKQWMLEADMQVRIDAAGNIIGRYVSGHGDQPAIATGSHLDTVPNAGHYDGAYGVLAGLEVVRTVKENNIKLKHPLEVIVFTDEEGSMIGCKALTGNFNPDPDSYHPVAGTIQTCLQGIGGDWHQLAQAKRDRHELAAFVELHVEQGPVLESASIQIGVVEGVVGQRRYTISVKGRASHAGTTPMSMRQDALVAAAQVVLSVNRLANLTGNQVATVGKMLVSPNAPNTIPAFVEMSLDIRDLSDQTLDTLIESLECDLKSIAATTQTQISLQPALRNKPALASQAIQTAIAQTCQELELTYLHLPSRAGHDAQEMAKLAEMGMIFVPSQNGLSHSESEYTSPEHCVQGANVLLHTLLKLDRQ
jgi:N-carbamoyl-L-amino-acid hydrolase